MMMKRLKHLKHKYRDWWDTQSLCRPAFFVGVAMMLVIGGIVFVWKNGGVFQRESENDQQTSVPESAVASPPSLLKIGFVTDWEYGTRKKLKHKLPAQALPELQNAVTYLNEVFHPDIVVGGGDYIESSSVKPESAKKQLAAVDAIFQTLSAPRVYALGNHDMRSLTKAEIREILGIEENHAIRDIGDWRIVVLDTNFNEDGSDRGQKSYVTGFVSDEERAWLTEALQTERPVLVFAHHSPVKSPSLNGAFSVNITNDVSVREILERSGVVMAVISGHSPYGYYEERNGIHYFVVDTMVNTLALGSFATLELRYSQETGAAEMIFHRTGGTNRQIEIVRWNFGIRKEEPGIFSEHTPALLAPSVSNPIVSDDDF